MTTDEIVESQTQYLLASIKRERAAHDRLVEENSWLRTDVDAQRIRQSSDQSKNFGPIVAGLVLTAVVAGLLLLFLWRTTGR